jgi:glycerol-3-phosphate acyltransferase PlsX
VDRRFVPVVSDGEGASGVDREGTGVETVTKRARIAIDAMGGDNAPGEIVAGALLAHRAGAVEVILVGDEARIGPLLGDDAGAISVVHAPGEIPMDMPAAQALRKSRGTSLGRVVDMVRDGSADAALSAGNSGAFLAIALVGLRTIAGIARPAIAAVLPTIGGPVVLCDAGANVDCRPEWIAQFALMGNAYAQTALGIARPRVAIVSIGEERTKGNQQTLDAAALLDDAPLNFIGHIEGKDIFEHHADVVACDGFVGNVILKTSEGAGAFINSMLREMIDDAPPLGKAGAFLLKPSFEKLRARLRYDTYGGAPLLGVRGACIVTHGRSNRVAISNAVRNAATLVERNLIGTIEAAVGEALAAVPDAPPAAAAGS